GLVMAGGVAYADWTGNTSGGQQIYFDKFTVPQAGALQVVSTTPAMAGGTFTFAGTLTFDVNFNRAVDPTSVQTTDLSLSGTSGVSVTGVSLLNGNTTARFTITTTAGSTAEGTLSATIAAGSITDTSSSPNVRFFSAYQLDWAATTSFQTPLTGISPLGSLIY